MNFETLKEMTGINASPETLEIVTSSAFETMAEVNGTSVDTVKTAIALNNNNAVKQFIQLFFAGFKTIEALDAM